MLKYLVILLDKTAVSYCHYNTPVTPSEPITLDLLKKTVLFAMKENLSVQFVYPKNKMPAEYSEIIESIDHCKIKPAAQATGADIIVFDGLEETEGFEFDTTKACVLRIGKEELFEKCDAIASLLGKTSRLNIVVTDVDSFSDNDIETYRTCLEMLSKKLEQLYVEGETPQCNLLTDRMMLAEMNNCGAGDTSITLGVDGYFYPCPAFAAEGSCKAGSLDGGICIKNQQLYRLDHAPICRNCDAWQCKRCVWLNRRMTLEVNTPSHEQCVMGHLERNASRSLLTTIRKHGTFLPEREEIKEIDYLDPFDKREEWTNS